LGGAFALDFDAVRVTVAAEGELGGEADGEDSGELADAVERGGEKADTGAVSVETPTGGLDLHREDVGGVEAGVDGEKMCHAAEQEAGSDEEDGGERDFRDNQSAAGPLAGSGGAAGGLPHAGVEVFAGKLEGGDEAEDDSDDCGGGEGEEKGSRVDGHRVNLRQAGRAEGDEGAEGGGCYRNAKDGADGGEEDGFGEELAHDTSAGCAESGPECELGAALGAAGEEEVGDVDAGDEHDE
jgi:hypothetical protein